MPLMGSLIAKENKVSDLRTFTTAGELSVEKRIWLCLRSRLVFILKAVSVFEKSIILL